MRVRWLQCGEFADGVERHSALAGLGSRLRELPERSLARGKFRGALCGLQRTLMLAARSIRGRQGDFQVCRGAVDGRRGLEGMDCRRCVVKGSRTTRQTEGSSQVRLGLQGVGLIECRAVVFEGLLDVVAGLECLRQPHLGFGRRDITNRALEQGEGAAGQRLIARGIRLQGEDTAGECEGRRFSAIGKRTDDIGRRGKQALAEKRFSQRAARWPGGRAERECLAQDLRRRLEVPEGDEQFAVLETPFEWGTRRGHRLGSGLQCLACPTFLAKPGGVCMQQAAVSGRSLNRGGQRRARGLQVSDSGLALRQGFPRFGLARIGCARGLELWQRLMRLPCSHHGAPEKTEREC